MKTKKAFTLVELLVVIAVIAMLMSVLMPALRMARDHAMRVLCGNDIRQILTACTIYGDRNNGRVPDERGDNGYWPWDVSAYATHELMEAMGKKIADYRPAIGTPQYIQQTDWIPVQDVFYCPANIQQKRQKESYWTYGTGGGTSRGRDIQGFRIWGYVPLWEDGYNSNGETPIYDTEDVYDMPGTSVPNLVKDWISRLDTQQASNAEFIVDSTLSQLVVAGNHSADLDQSKYPYGSFVVTLGGQPGSEGVPDQANHMISDSKVAGGNIGFVDNHVEWRAFTQMQCRYSTGGLGSDGPKWWW